MDPVWVFIYAGLEASQALGQLLLVSVAVSGRLLLPQPMSSPLHRSASRAALGDLARGHRIKRWLRSMIPNSVRASIKPRSLSIT